MIEGFIIDMKDLSCLSQEAFLADRKASAAGESFLRRSLECMFDIARHIMAKSYGYRGLEYKEIAKGLGEKGIVTKDFSLTLIKMAGYRNRMVHLYREITYEEIHSILKNHLSDIERFVKEIATFIKKYEKNLDSLPK